MRDEMKMATDELFAGTIQLSVAGMCSSQAKVVLKNGIQRLAML